LPSDSSASLPATTFAGLALIVLGIVGATYATVSRRLRR
jgi:hypothetical protein